MKNLVLLTFLLFSFTTNAATERVLMTDYVGTDMDRMFEVKTNKFDKGILDCQSFIQGLTFYKDSQVVHSFYIDSFECEGLHDYLQSAKDNKVDICFELNGQSLDIVESSFAECK